MPGNNCGLCKMLAKGKEQPTFIADFRQSVAFVYKDQIYRGRTIVVLKTHANDIQSVHIGAATELYQEMMKVAKAVAVCFHPDKMNYAMLGNRVRWHVHWHIIPRYRGDVRWGKAPWPHPRKYLNERGYSKLALDIRNALQHMPVE